jgi:hypothetical protein
VELHRRARTSRHAGTDLNYFFAGPKVSMSLMRR